MPITYLLAAALQAAPCPSPAALSPARVPAIHRSSQPLTAEDDKESAESSRVAFLPAGNLYPANVADPHRRGFGVQLMSFRDAEIPDSGDSRLALKLGGRFGLVRWSSGHSHQRQWQLGIETGFYGQFDNDFSQDNLGWDGFYGLVLSTRRAGGRAWRVGTMHTSSHVGDELIERTGRQRIGYTRHEALAGISQPLARWLRLYAEVGWAFSVRNPDLQEPGRGQVGLVLERPESLLGSRLGWYTALDLSATEEREWEVDAALQIGVMHCTGLRCWRAGAEYYDGRPPMGEFFRDSERAISLGLWLDL